MVTFMVRKVAVVCCAHRIPNHPHCDPVHGHNFTIAMEVTALKLLPPYDFVVDFGDLKTIAKRWDHSGLVYEGSAEYMAEAIGRAILLLDATHKFVEVAVMVEETPGSEAEWRWTRDNLETG